MAAALDEPALRVLQRNGPATTSVIISLHEETDDLAISQALSAHNGVTRVAVALSGASTPGPNNNQGWSSLRQVLASKTSLEHISLIGDFSSENEELRPPHEIVKLFMESVQRNNAVRQLDLIHLRLPGPETVSLVEEMSSVTALSVYACTMHAADGGSEEEGAQAIANALQKSQTIGIFLFAPNFANPSCSLSIVRGVVSNKHLHRLCVDLQRQGSGIETDRYETTVAACLETASKCQNLREVSITGVGHEATFRAMVQAIPHFQMRHADFQLPAYEEDRVFRLLTALQHNFKLFSTRVIDSDQTNILDEAASEQLSRYLLRNERLADWVAHPESVPKNLWPEALAVARQAGEETLWQSLLKVGPEIANGKKGRKRKRTLFYDPSA